MNRKGLTLIEVLVTITIMAIVFGVLLTSLMLSFRGDRVAQERTQAIHFTENLLELYRLRWQDPSNYALAVPPKSGDISLIARHLPRDAHYEVSVERLDIDGSPWSNTGPPPLQKVRARVLDSSGREIARSTILIPNPDLGSALR